jgi:hypothetical protein
MTTLLAAVDNSHGEDSLFQFGILYINRHFNGSEVGVFDVRAFAVGSQRRAFIDDAWE